MASPRQHPLAQMWEDFDALFDRYLNQWPALWDDDSGQARLWDFDVNETENEVVVRAELPGFDPEDLDVQVRDNTLRIQAEKRQEGRTGEGDGAREQRSSTYLRTMTLPAGINADQVTATYRNGVLELHMPRPAESKSKRIAIGGPEKTAEPAAATAGAGEAHGRGNGSKRQAQSEAAEGPAKAARKR